jgi:hypothetical protein
MNKIHLLEASFFEVHFEEGQFIFKYEKNISVDLKMYFEYRDTCEAIYTNLGRPFPVLADITGFMRVQKEARDIARNDHGHGYFYVVACYTSSLVLHSLMTLIGKIIGHGAIPLEYFQDYSEAQEFLESKRIELGHAPILAEEVKGIWDSTPTPKSDSEVSSGKNRTEEE